MKIPGVSKCLLPLKKMNGISAMRMSELSIPKQQGSLDPEFLATFSAFSARTGIKFENGQTFLDSITHTSFPSSSDKSSRYQLLGEKVLNMYSTEYVMNKYPVVPAGVIYSIVDAFVGQKSLASIGKNFGIQHVVRWKMSSQKLEKPLPLPPVVYAWIVQAMIGALFTEQGPKAVKQVMQKHIFSRAIDADEHINMHIKLNKPRKLLLDIFKSLNKPKPTARLIKETGRNSQTPIFIVGMYSGFEKLSEGVGSSKQMAETRVILINKAVKNALISHYSVELKNFKVPTDSEDDDSITFFQE